MPSYEVAAVDLLVLAGYVIETRILFSWYFSRRASEGAESDFLGGRRMRWPIIGLSFYVANMGGGSLVGLPGSGYHDGKGRRPLGRVPCGARASTPLPE